MEGESCEYGRMEDPSEGGEGKDENEGRNDFDRDATRGRRGGVHKKDSLSFSHYDRAQGGIEKEG